MNRNGKRLLSLLLWIMLAIAASGCWNRRELNELSVVLAMGIDQVGDQYEISLQTVDPSQMGRNRKTERSPTTVYSERAPTLFEAIRKITTKASRRMYGSHLHLLLFDENVARAGIRRTLDLMLRDHEVRPDFHVAVVKNRKAKEVLAMITPTEVLPGMELYKSLRASQKTWAPTAAVSAKELMKMLLKKGVDPVLTGLTLTGNREKGGLPDNARRPDPYEIYQYTGIGVFRDDRLVGWLNDTESKAYNYITNHIYSTVLTVPCPHAPGNFVVEVTKSKIKIEPRIVDGEPRIRLVADTEGNIAEVACAADLKNQETFNDLEQAVMKLTKSRLLNGIQRVQKQYASDIFGFGEAFHRKYPKQWHQWKDDWNRQFQKLPVEIEQKYRLLHFGRMINPTDDHVKQEEQ